MRYNFDENRPYYYAGRKYDTQVIAELKKSVHHYPDVKEGFDSVNWDPYLYVYRHIYDTVSDKDDRDSIIWDLFGSAPVRIYIDKIIEKESAYFCFFEEVVQAWDNESHWRTDVFSYLFFCETEMDFWDFFVEGRANIEEMVSLYEEYDSVDKCRDFLTNIYHRSKEKEQVTISTLYTKGISLKGRRSRIAIYKRVRKTAVSLLLKQYDLTEIQDAKAAWDTGILELRQEFVKNDQLILLLKKIL